MNAQQNVLKDHIKKFILSIPCLIFLMNQCVHRFPFVFYGELHYGRAFDYPLASQLQQQLLVLLDKSENMRNGGKMKN